MTLFPQKMVEKKIEKITAKDLDCNCGNRTEPVVQQIVARATDIEHISASLQIGSVETKSLRDMHVC